MVSSTKTNTTIDHSKYELLVAIFLIQSLSQFSINLNTAFFKAIDFKLYLNHLGKTVPGTLSK